MQSELGRDSSRFQKTAAVTRSVLIGLATAWVGAALIGVGGCATPEVLQPDESNKPVKIEALDGRITQEVAYRGWDHCFQVSDGAVEAIFVPAVGRLMRFAPVGGAVPSNASAAASADDVNFFWLNSKWTGIVPTPFDAAGQDHPRDYRLFGGLRDWVGPQEKWPTSRAPDLRKLIDVDVAWPPDPGLDLMPYKYLDDKFNQPGQARFKSALTSKTGMRGVLSIEAPVAKSGAVTLRFAKENTTADPVEASSWVAMTLRQRGYIAVRRDQLASEPAVWPAGSSFVGPWAILPLETRPDDGFSLAIQPAAGTTGHVVVLHDSILYSVQSTRPATGEYPPGRTLMTIERDVIGCPPQVVLSDPECDEHFEIAASSPLMTVAPGGSVELAIQLTSRAVTAFELPELKAYLEAAVKQENLAPLPAPNVSGETTVIAPNPPPVKKPDDTMEYPPPLPESNPPPVKPAPPPAKPPIDPNKPPTMGPVSG